MVSKGLLTWVLVAEASVLSASVVLLAVHSIWTWWHTRWSRPVLAMARAILRDALEEPLPPKTAVELLDSLPAAVQIGVFADLAIGVAGEQRQRLAAIAVELGLSARAEARCHSRLWWRQLRGARLVTLVGTGEEVMPTLLRDRHPVIRAQAAEWAAEHPSPALAAELVAMLGDSSGLCRFAAQDSLMRMGDVVAEPLVEYLSARSGERVAAALSVPMAALLVRYPGRVGRTLEGVSYTGYALPGVVVALALVFFGARYAFPVYQTIWLLMFAYVVLFFPVALGAVRSSLLQVNPRLEEAARGLGRTPLQVLVSVTGPMMRPGILAGAALVFLVAMKELPATLILGPLGFKSLATNVWSASSEAFFAQAAVPALMLILISSVPTAFLVIRGGRTNA